MLKPPANLRIRLLNSDSLPINDAPDTVWEIDANTSHPDSRPIRVKGSFLNQTLPAGTYRVRAYTAAGEFDEDVTLAPGQELDTSINVGVP